MSVDQEEQGGRRQGRFGFPKQKAALPGEGGLERLVRATVVSVRGIGHGASTEAAIKQELVVLAVALPLSFVIAQSVMQWLMLIGALFLVLVAEFLNTAVERLCNHVTPRLDEEIRDIKDLASGGVFFTIVFAALVWVSVVLLNFGIFS